MSCHPQCSVMSFGYPSLLAPLILHTCSDFLCSFVCGVLANSRLSFTGSFQCQSNRGNHFPKDRSKPSWIFLTTKKDDPTLRMGLGDSFHIAAGCSLAILNQPQVTLKHHLHKGVLHNSEEIKEDAWQFAFNCVAIATGWLQTRNLPASVSWVLGFYTCVHHTLRLVLAVNIHPPTHELFCISFLISVSSCFIDPSVRKKDLGPLDRRKVPTREETWVDLTCIFYLPF